MTVQAGELYEGRYRVVEALSQGGFGQTFVAQDEESGERVVLKTLRLDRAEDWKSIELFEREAKMLEQLDHPGIPSYLDWFEVGEEAWCLVQRLAPGETLADRVASGWSPTEDEVMALAKSALEVLVYLQERHPPIVHRDVKPENLLVDDAGRVSLVDFGSVKASATGGRGSTVAGTFGYMAPEQLRGVATERTDLFGLGTTLLHVMTGKQPEDLPTSRLKIDTSEAIPRASRGLRAWLDRMIDPIEEERFADAEAALGALDAPAEVVANPSGAVEPGDIEPPPFEPLPPRGERHEELDALRRKRRGRLFVWSLVMIVGMLIHAVGVNTEALGGMSEAIGILLGLPVMGIGVLGMIPSWAKLKRSRTQDRVERLTGKSLPVDEGGWVPVEVTRRGKGGLTLMRRRGAFGNVVYGLFVGFVAWMMMLVTLNLGWSSALSDTLDILGHPVVWLTVYTPMLITHAIARFGRPTLEIDKDKTWFTKSGGTIEADALESWRVGTRKRITGGKEHGKHIGVYATKKGEPEREVFSVHDNSVEGARATARMLHELIEEHVGPSGGRGVSSGSTGVVLGLDEEGAAVEEASKVEVGAKG